jgi:hypothetical protein
MNISGPTGQVHPVIGPVQCRPQGPGADDPCRWRIPWRHHDARKHVERDNPIVLFEKALSYLPYVLFRQIPIPIVYRIHRHEAIQIFLSNGVLRSIEDLLDVIHSPSVRLNARPGVDPECARLKN